MQEREHTRQELVKIDKVRRYLLEEYYTFTTEESEKMELFALADKLGGNLELAVKRLAESKRNPQLSTT